MAGEAPNLSPCMRLEALILEMNVAAPIHTSVYCVHFTTDALFYALCLVQSYSGHGSAADINATQTSFKNSSTKDTYVCMISYNLFLPLN